MTWHDAPRRIVLAGRAAPMPAVALGDATTHPHGRDYMKIIEAYLRFTDWLNAKFAWIVAFLIVPMLCIMIWEIVMRYFFNAPSLWAYEISLFLYGGYIVLGGAYTHLAGGHVNVDIIWGRLRPRGRAFVDILTSGFVFLFVGVLFWYSLQRTILSWQLGETTMSHWQPIIYPLRTTLPVGCLLLLMQVVAKLIRDIATVVTGEDDYFPIRVKIPGLQLNVPVN